MSVRDLIPWSRSDENRAPTVFREGERDPFLSLQRDVNRLFDDVLRGFGSSLPAFAGQWPSIEIADRETEIEVTAEMPGLDEKDVEVLLQDGALVLKGEKRSETQDRDRQFSERFYGRFERRIPLGCEVENDAIDARFKNGVLTVSLPKSERARSQVRRIAITS